MNFLPALAELPPPERLKRMEAWFAAALIAYDDAELEGSGPDLPEPSRN